MIKLIEKTRTDEERKRIAEEKLEDVIRTLSQFPVRLTDESKNHLPLIANGNSYEDGTKEHSLNDVSAIYCIYHISNLQVPVYIGRAKNVGGRKAEHAKALDLRSEDPLGKGGKDHMAKKLVSYDDNPTNWRIEILGYSNDIIYTLERLFIEQYKPFLNDRDTIPTKQDWIDWYNQCSKAA